MKSAQPQLIRRAVGLAIALTCSAAGWATAQSIELSSPSLGTVVVTPGGNRVQATSAASLPLGPTGSTPVQSAVPTRNATDTRGLQRSAANGQAGIDLGISPNTPRNADGSLFDALDPAQNPAAASNINGNGANNGATNAGTNGSNGANNPNGVGINTNSGVAGFPVGTIAPDGRRPGTSDLGNPTSAGTNNGNSATNNGRSFPRVNGGTGINNSGTSGNGLSDASGVNNGTANNNTGQNAAGANATSGNGLGASSGVNPSGMGGRVGGGNGSGGGSVGGGAGGAGAGGR